MIGTVHPALQTFLADWGQSEGQKDRPCLFAQVSIHRLGRGFELRHQADQGADLRSLRTVPVQELRALAQTTAAGAFRPLRSAPNLASGWRTEVPDELELESALQQLYPGALADWYAVRLSTRSATSFREFTRRQSGMYRITAMLSDAQAARITRACCPARFCLKRRLWTVGAEPVDSVAEKSLIPCLEPCAIFLEFARKAARIDQESALEVPTTPTDRETALTALSQVLAAGLKEFKGREADFDDPTNPRRVALCYEKLKESGRLSPQ
jgi:hypothetical protein